MWKRFVVSLKAISTCSSARMRKLENWRKSLLLLNPVRRYIVYNFMTFNNIRVKMIFIRSYCIVANAMVNWCSD